MSTRDVDMAFRYGSAFGISAPDAYETLLVDVMRRDQTLFMRHDEVECAWGIVSPILAAWESTGTPPLESYPAGSQGPAASHALLARGEHAWRKLG